MNQLAPHHYTELHEKSGISPEVIAASGAYTETTAGGVRRIGFAPYQARPGLVFPYPTVNGWPESYVIKPDNPRTETRPSGKVRRVKYEPPEGSPNRIYCPPQVLGDLGNAAKRLLVTEGIKKTLKAVTDGYSCVGLQGVFNFVGKHDTPFAVPLADWGYINLKGRQVGICFDSDIAENETVRLGCDRLAHLLIALGARPYLVILPTAPDGSKQGLDDYLVNNPGANVWALARPWQDGQLETLQRKLEAERTLRQQLQARESAMARLAANKHTRKFFPVAIRAAAELDKVKAQESPTEQGDYRISQSRVRGVEYDKYGKPRTDVMPICSEGTVSSHLEEIGKIVPEFQVDKRPGIVTLTRKDRNTGEKIKQEIPSTLTYVKWNGSSTDLLNTLASYRTEQPERRGGKRCPSCGSKKYRVRYECTDCGDVFNAPAEEIPATEQNATTEPPHDPDPAMTQAFEDLYRRAKSRAESPAAKFAAGETQAGGTESPLIPLAINFAAGTLEPPPLPEGYFDSLIDPQAKFAAGETVRCTFGPYGCDCPHPEDCTDKGRCSP